MLMLMLRLKTYGVRSGERGVDQPRLYVNDILVLGPHSRATATSFHLNLGSVKP
jgi:hypothetical protein